MSIKSVRTILTEYREKFTWVFLIVLGASAFLMNFVSLPGLLQGTILFAEQVAVYNILFLLLFSFLASLAVILHMYKAEKFRSSKVTKAAPLGAFFGMFASACSVCYPLVLTALGIPVAFAFLPFGGAEFQLISISLLLVSIFLLSREIENCEKCKTRESNYS